MSVTGLPALLARIAVAQADLLLRGGVALQEAVDELITVPSQDRVPVELGTLKASARTTDPVIQGASATVYATYGRDDDGSGTEAPTNAYAVVVHENLSAQHAQGGPKYLEIPAMEVAPLLPEAVAKRLRK